MNPVRRYWLFCIFVTYFIFSPHIYAEKLIVDCPEGHCGYFTLKVTSLPSPQSFKTLIDSQELFNIPDSMYNTWVGKVTEIDEIYYKVNLRDEITDSARVYLLYVYIPIEKMGVETISQCFGCFDKDSPAFSPELSNLSQCYKINKHHSYYHDDYSKHFNNGNWHVYDTRDEFYRLEREKSKIWCSFDERTQRWAVSPGKYTLEVEYYVKDILPSVSFECDTADWLVKKKVTEMVIAEKELVILTLQDKDFLDFEFKIERLPVSED